MKPHWIAFLSTCLALGALAPQATAGERRVQRAEVPAAVLAAAAARYPGARTTRYTIESEHGVVTYELRVELEALRAEISYAANGSLVNEERVLDQATLPPPVIAAVAARCDQRSGRCRVHKVEQVTEAAHPLAPSFELAVTLAGKHREWVFDLAGKLLRDERADER